MSPRARGRASTDLSAVLGAIARTAASLCEARDALIFLVNGDQHRLVARHGNLRQPEPLGARRLISRDTPLGRALLDRKPVHVRDLGVEVHGRFKGVAELYRVVRVRSLLAMPLLRGGSAIGGIVIRRTRVQPFTTKQIALLKTFADQAAIAIENARLSETLEARNSELTEALERETATSEVLRVISGSPTSLQPVLDTIAERAAVLCGAFDTALYLEDAGELRLAAHHGPIPVIESARVLAIDRATVGGRAFVEARAIHVLDLQAEETEFPTGAMLASRAGYRTVLAVPLLREGNPVGEIGARRTEADAFSPSQVALLKTFADQAVIAIENMRLFTELQARNRELTEALERQTATAEILRVIGSSPTEVQPVFDAIARSGVRVCGALGCAVFVVDGEMISVAATHGLRPERLERFRTEYPVPLAGDDQTARRIRAGNVFQLADIENNPHASKRDVETARLGGYRTRLMVPMTRGDSVFGLIAVIRQDPAPFPDRQVELLKTFAEQAVIAIENVRLFNELEARNRALGEALEQQTVTADILRVISSSPTDTQPVFDTIIRNAVRLSGAAWGLVTRVEARLIDFVAHHNLDADVLARLRRMWPHLVDGRGPTSRVVGSGQIFRAADVEAEDCGLSAEALADFRARGIRSMVVVPMSRHGRVIGTINLTHQAVGAFSDAHVALIRTFADQAVIAIENVRLFKELQTKNADLTDALEQQTATSEILRVISRSPTDVQPVFDAIVGNAVRLCGAVYGIVWRYDGETIHVGAVHSLPEAEETDLRNRYPRSFSEGDEIHKMMRSGRVIDVPDVEQATDIPPMLLANWRRRNVRSAVILPMQREHEAVGAIGVSHREPGAFSPGRVELLKTFADQAVIAIANVRLFTALQERNRALTEALDQQTATSEILRVISSTPTDVQPVFEAIIRSAVRLCDALQGVVYRFDGELMHMAAHHHVPAAVLEILHRTYPRRPDRESLTNRAILDGVVVHVEDTREVSAPVTRVLADASDFRTLLAVPMIRDGRPIGIVTVVRREKRSFTDSQVALLKTFADQAVIAIENVRLFNELQARTHELTRSVGQLTALGEVGQAVSSTLDLETVLTTIAARASQLTGTDTCTVYEYDEQTEEFHLRATHNVDERVLELTRIRPIRKGEGVAGRVAETREPVQIEDVAQEGAYHGPLREALLQAGVRSVLAAPLLREDRLIGVLIVTRKMTGRFADEVIALLQTFATQSAIAIQNARLFRELEAKSRELEVASRHKSQFLANMSHELRTPMNAILGYTELIADGIYGGVPPPMRDVLGRVEASGRHLLGLISDVLDLSKIEAGQLTLMLADYSMKEVVEAVVAAVESLAAEKRLRLVVDLAPDLPTGRGDQRRLAQVLLNLVGNAIKFTEQGQIAIRVGAAADFFTVAVSDSGPGIAPADQERIFEEFQQADTSTTRPKGGTGLGLAIARRILTMHGGRIWVESVAGEGATFRFTIPVRVEQQAVHHSAATS